MRIPGAVFVPLLGAVSQWAHAQPLDLRITALGCNVRIPEFQLSQLIAPNTDVSNGYRISVEAPRGVSATSQLTVSRAASAYAIDLDDSTTLLSGTHPGVTSGLRITLSAGRPARIRLDARWTWQGMAFQFGATGRLMLGTRVLTEFGGTPVYQGGASTTIDVGPTPVELSLFDESLLSFPVQMQWRLLLTPDDRCGVVTYGAACGSAALLIGSDLLQPGRSFVEFQVAQLPSPGYLIAGLLRQSIPIGPCFLHNEALVVLPTANRLYFDPPPVPGFALKLQGGTIVGNQLVLSAGSDLTCR
jgi:hypothetical protein